MSYAKLSYRLLLKFEYAPHFRQVYCLLFSLAFVNQTIKQLSNLEKNMSLATELFHISFPHSLELPNEDRLREAREKIREKQNDMKRKFISKAVSKELLDKTCSL